MPLNEIYGTENRGIPEECQSIQEKLVEIGFPDNVAPFFERVIKEHLAEEGAVARSEGHPENPTVALASGRQFQTETREGKDNDADFDFVKMAMESFASDKPMTQEEIFSVFYKELQKRNYDLAYLLKFYSNIFRDNDFFKQTLWPLAFQIVKAKKEELKTDELIDNSFIDVFALLKTCHEIKQTQAYPDLLLRYIESIKEFQCYVDKGHVIFLCVNASKLAEVCQSLTAREGFSETGEFRVKLDQPVDGFEDNMDCENYFELITRIFDLLQATIPAPQHQ